MHCALFGVLMTSGGNAQAQLGNEVRQVIVAQAAGWNSNTAVLQAYQRPAANAPWQPVFPKGVPVPLS